MTSSTQNSGPIARTLRDRVADSVRRMILDGVLSPGERVSPDRLAAEFGTSAMPIREALRELESEELVEFKPYKGVFVTSISPEDAEEMYVMRAALEALGAKVGVPNLDPSRLKAMENELEKMYKAIEAEESEAYYAADRAFHETIYAAAERAGLLKKVRDMRDSSIRYSRLYEGLSGVREKALSENKDILEACKNHDVELAASLTHEHIIAAGEGVMQQTKDHLVQAPHADS